MSAHGHSRAEGAAGPRGSPPQPWDPRSQPPTPLTPCRTPAPRWDGWHGSGQRDTGAPWWRAVARATLPSPAQARAPAGSGCPQGQAGPGHRGEAEGDGVDVAGCRAALAVAPVPASRGGRAVLGGEVAAPCPVPVPGYDRGEWMGRGLGTAPPWCRGGGSINQFVASGERLYRAGRKWRGLRRQLESKGSLTLALPLLMSGVYRSWRQPLRAAP